jgi:hypothetical protein
MKLKLTKVILFVLLNIGFAKGQTKDFKLAEYTLPNLTLRSLSLTFGASQSVSKNTILDSQINYETTPSSYGGNSNLYFKKFDNNQIWQREKYINAALSLRFNDQQGTNMQYQKTTSLFSSFDTKSVNRKYVEPKKFREFNYHILSSFDWSKKYYSSSVGNTERTTPFEFDFIGIIPIKFGKGRIEQVTDARHAIFILEKLKEKGKLTKELNQNEIREFAEMISKINYTRYFDFRLQRIFELEAVDSFLQSKNYISETDITYFTNLNDMWIYGKGPLRYSGKRISFAFYPGYNFLAFTADNANQYAHTLNASMGYEYTLEKPINLYWQNSLEVYTYTGIIAGKTERKVSDYQKTYVVPTLSVGATDKVGFYPNTRTSIEFTGRIHSTLAIGEANAEANKLALNGYGVNVESGFNFYYFISPRLDISIGLNIQFDVVKEYDVSDFNFDSPLRNNLLYLLNYPQCETSNCYYYSYQNQSKRFSNYLNISIGYDLF